MIAFTPAPQPDHSGVLTAHLPLPRPVDVVTPRAAPDIQEAQACLGVGFDRALRNLKLAGVGDVLALHVIRIVSVAVLGSFERSDVTTDRALMALVDRLEREGWLGGCR